MGRAWKFSLIGCALAGLAATCGGSSDNTTTESGGPGGLNGGNGGSGAGTGFLTGGGGQGGDNFDECEGFDEAAELVPVNMFIQFDKSGSMDNDNKWDNATGALSTFFADPGAAGLRVALRFFPTNDCGCDVDDCAQMEVGLGPLTADPAPMDVQEQALLDAVDANDPDGNTPLYAALAGAIQAAETQLMNNPAEKSVVIVVTDGEPNGCNEDYDDIAALAADGVQNGVLTYAIGLAGSNENLMNMIAQEGGTMQAFLIGNGNTSQDLLTALQQIQGNTVSCSFVVPETASNGETIDPNQVNLVVNAGGGSTKVPQVADSGSCGNGPGWYYDDPANPSVITLCPDYCAEIQADESAQITLEFGCATETPQ